MHGQRVVERPAAPVGGEALHGELRVEPRHVGRLEVGLDGERDVGHDVFVVGDDVELAQRRRRAAAVLVHDGVDERGVADARRAEDVAAHVGQRRRRRRREHEPVEQREHGDGGAERVARDVERGGGGIDDVLFERAPERAAHLEVDLPEAAVRHDVAAPVRVRVRVPARSQSHLFHLEVLLPLGVGLRAAERDPHLVVAAAAAAAAHAQHPPDVFVLVVSRAAAQDGEHLGVGARRGVDALHGGLLEHGDDLRGELGGGQREGRRRR